MLSSESCFPTLWVLLSHYFLLLLYGIIFHEGCKLRFPYFLKKFFPSFISQASSTWPQPLTQWFWHIQQHHTLSTALPQRGRISCNTAEASKQCHTACVLLLCRGPSGLVARASDFGPNPRIFSVDLILSLSRHHYLSQCTDCFSKYQSASLPQGLK